MIKNTMYLSQNTQMAVGKNLNYGLYGEELLYITIERATERRELLGTTEKFVRSSRGQTFTSNLKR